MKSSTLRKKSKLQPNDTITAKKLYNLEDKDINVTWRNHFLSSNHIFSRMKMYAMRWTQKQKQKMINELLVCIYSSQLLVNKSEYLVDTLSFLGCYMSSLNHFNTSECPLNVIEFSSKLLVNINIPTTSILLDTHFFPGTLHVVTHVQVI